MYVLVRGQRLSLPTPLDWQGRKKGVGMSPLCSEISSGCAVCCVAAFSSGSSTISIRASPLRHSTDGPLHFRSGPSDPLVSASKTR